jgi:hypothetical protein
MLLYRQEVDRARQEAAQSADQAAEYQKKEAQAQQQAAELQRNLERYVGCLEDACTTCMSHLA